MTYLRKAAAIEIDLHQVGWTDILKYGELRNHLVHAGPNANAAGDPQQRIRRLLKLPHLIVEADGELALEPSFIADAIGRFQPLLKAVYDGYESEKAARAKQRVPHEWE